ncbi:endonuclease III domain-containing protein [Halorussus ruber]|uniref:endonuclease III domain-containing protein n=1 Tax=Halorussus ruber TaxID=1126238 RepID=UPI00109241CE|nr:endonuclease III [Halorussus ruber]
MSEDAEPAEADLELDGGDPEPVENISGGDPAASSVAEFEAGEAKTRAEEVVNRLGERYWQKTYGGQDAFECLVRTILSQNTSDKASQPAHDALMERYGSSDGEDRDLAVALADAVHDELADTIRPAGLYNQKADVLISVADRVLAEYGSAAEFDAFVREADPEEVRPVLLDFGGVGPKTADCVLLFSGGQAGVFPVDTHVHRIYRRLGVAPPDADHEAVRAVLEREVPAEKCGFGHTASIQFGREYCSARKPACLNGLDECPMSDICDRVGVDIETGAVVDPADAASDAD